MVSRSTFPTWTTLGATTGLVAVLLAGLTSPAAAAPKKPDPSEVVSVVFTETPARSVSLAEAGANTLDTPGTLDSVEATASATYATRCREITGAVSGKNIYGANLFTFRQVSTWCYNGAKITSRSSYNSVTCCYTLWKYMGSSVLNNQLLYTSWLWRRTSQGRFCHDINPLPWGGGDCATEKRPWVSQDMWADGTYSQTGGV